MMSLEQDKKLCLKLSSSISSGFWSVSHYFTHSIEENLEKTNPFFATLKGYQNCFNGYDMFLFLSQPLFELKKKIAREKAAMKRIINESRCCQVSGR